MALILLAIFLVTLVQLSTGVPLDNKGSVYIESRIVGGVDAPENYAPHMMALVFGEQISNLICGASIISNMHVLTAAHCIDVVKTREGLKSSLCGVCGSNQWTSTEICKKFTHHKNHEDWDSLLIKNDIGVLFLKEELKMSYRVSAIPLEFDWVDAGEKSYVTGWGRLWAWGPIPDQLQVLYVETIEIKRCEEAILEAASGWWSPPVDQNIEVCTLHPKGQGHGMCNGDSGSALVSVETGKQFGIVSWGFPCALGAPDMFVRISGFKKWLENVLNK